MWPFKSKWDVYQWLLQNPGWHYGLDIVAAGVSSRGMIYPRLAVLEGHGLVERRYDTLPTPFTGLLPRPMYRAVLLP